MDCRLAIGVPNAEAFNSFRLGGLTLALDFEQEQNSKTLQFLRGCRWTPSIWAIRVLGYYSVRSARMGSSVAARRAGITAAGNAAAASAVAVGSRMRRS